MKPHVSIVSGTYNRLPILQNMVRSARESIPPGVRYELILVDGGSTDGTIEWAKEQPDMTLIEQGELLGAIKAFDAGAFAASAPYVILANDDIEFVAGSITTALAHLEENPKCGAVAFEDNRPLHPGRTEFHVLGMPATGNAANWVHYAQVGMFRKWLGDAVGWWGLNGRMTARTYGGDNALSAAIWEAGYTVDAVEGCRVIDFVHDDELREINTHQETPGHHPDSKAYYDLFPTGPAIGSKPLSPPDSRQRQNGLRILYLPIYEAGRGKAQLHQRQQKRGLRDALGKLGMVYEVDYLAYQYRVPELTRDLTRIVSGFQPDVMIAQVHATDVLTADALMEVRAHCPRMVTVNWNGDYWPEAQTSPVMIDWMRYIDLALVVNADVLPVYQGHGIPCAYWQIGFEQPPGQLPDMPKHDVVFLGQNYNQERREFGDVLLSMREAGIDVAIYGNGWGEGEGIHPDCTYDFLTGAALYQNAKITVANNPFMDSLGFVSNRIFQALAEGGALMLHQKVKGLADLTGITPGVHYIEWTTYDELRQWVTYFTNPDHEADRLKIVDAAARYVRQFHSFDARVRQLFTELLPLAKQRQRYNAVLRYVGRRETEFGIVGKRTGKQYTVKPGRDLVVDALDLPGFMLEPDIWSEVTSGSLNRTYA